MSEKKYPWVCAKNVHVPSCKILQDRIDARVASGEHVLDVYLDILSDGAYKYIAEEIKKVKPFRRRNELA